MTNQPYIELSLRVGEERFELLIALLHQLGFESFLEEGDALRAYVAASEWTSEKESEARTLVRSLVGDDVALETRRIEPRNWNAEWERSLAPIEIDDWLVIVQSGKSVQPKPNRLVVEINPKMSFGTGYHETTRLMLRAMRALMEPDDRVLDVGTGTGVLAIVARKLGNRHPICACDNDEWAVLNAKENCAINQAESIEVLQLDAPNGIEPLLAERGFSLVLANLNRAVLEKLLPAIARLSPNSKVLVSGLLKYDLDWLKNSLAELNFALARLWEEGEWICALVHRQTT
ncbi:MAG: 50S ribosomal protein L11 methyltransferase [Chloroherpetonaceae bacterium]|nr:50S ribosomal protein L11 methyltransferase [Chloroherpetonaceae bacterium]